MHQSDLSLADKTGIQSDVLIINQCDAEKIVEEKREFGTVKCVYTKERGLSKSRNMAIDFATGDYCLLCDDDETLDLDYAEKIVAEFEKRPKADIIAFQVRRKDKAYPNKAFKVGYLRSLKIASWQIVLRRESICRAGVKFDTNFGSGTPVGSGEENIFMYDCLKKGLKIYYAPVCIGSVAQKESRWFKGFTKEYFLNRGTIIHRLMGGYLGSIYCIYFALSKYPRYRDNFRVLDVICMLFRGMKRWRA